MASTVSTAITLEEFLNDNANSTDRWRQWFSEHLEALATPCDIYDSKTVAGLVKHILVVELRHSQRLTNQRVVAYEEIAATSVKELFEVHDQALKNLRSFIANATEGSLGQDLEIQTLSADTLHASRRKLFVHIMIHSKRHWAQLATLLREHGLTTDWPQDFLFSESMA